MNNIIIIISISIRHLAAKLALVLLGYLPDQTPCGWGGKPQGTLTKAQLKNLQSWSHQTSLAN
jgi:hypothetical protein